MFAFGAARRKTSCKLSYRSKERRKNNKDIAKWQARDVVNGMKKMEFTNNQTER
jgi:hypothetical protein